MPVFFQQFPHFVAPADRSRAGLKRSLAERIFSGVLPFRQKNGSGPQKRSAAGAFIT